MLKFLIICLTTAVIIQTNAALPKLVGYSEYVDSIAKLVSYHIENQPKLQTKDYIMNINKTIFEYEIIGSLNLTNGFIGGSKHEHLSVTTNVVESDSSAAVIWKLYLNNPQFYFNYNASLSVGDFQGLATFSLSSLPIFTLKIEKRFLDNSLTVSVPQKTSWNYGLKWNLLPSSNKYLQILVNEINYVKELNEAMDDMSSIIIKALSKSVAAGPPFPELCFNC